MMLYQLDLSGQLPERGIERFMSSFANGEDLDPALSFFNQPAVELSAEEGSPVRAYAIELVEGVMRQRERLDKEIALVSTHWRLDRMARVDLNLLRLGAYEILVCEDRVPRKVAINEAVEIAKRFGTDESSAFINGILDRVGKA